ncbi:TIGR04211 family SH3 domain-containing protein [Nitrospira sp. M1]
MKRFIYLVLFMFFYLGFPVPLLAAVGDVNYISDVLKVPMRSGPTPGHRIIHSGLPSGTRLTVLATDEEGEFTQVRTDGGTEGWLRSQYLVASPIARDKLVAAEKRLQRLEAQMAKDRTAHTAIQAENKASEATNRELNAQVTALTNELAELKRVSANPIKEHAHNVELTQQNERLRHDVSELSSTVKKLEDNVQRDWLLYGGALVVLGLLLGVTIKARPRKTSSSYSSRYM